MGAHDLEVVVVLGVDGGEQGGSPGGEQVCDRVRRSLAGVVPSLEGSDDERILQLHVLLDVHHLSRVRRTGARDARAGRPRQGFRRT
ncbi:MAG: hypothetical protein M3Q82_03795 [Actinomycetota bacterium]|nr:hypothetical protein [Actinomycetota bacterium]